MMVQGQKQTASKSLRSSADSIFLYCPVRRSEQGPAGKGNDWLAVPRPGHSEPSIEGEIVYLTSRHSPSINDKHLQETKG